MATTTETKTTCDRCKTRPAPPRALVPTGATYTPALSLKFGKVTVEYEDICPKCAGVCEDALRVLGKQARQRKRAPRAATPTQAEA